MGRKETVIGVARHSIEEEEITRIIAEYEKTFGTRISKLEASAILAERSKSVFWTEQKLKKALSKLRGLP